MGDTDRNPAGFFVSTADRPTPLDLYLLRSLPLVCGEQVHPVKQVAIRATFSAMSQPKVRPWCVRDRFHFSCGEQSGQPGRNAPNDGARKYRGVPYLYWSDPNVMT